ncbi:glucose-1-phosphate adenylyltransferase [Tautonia sociabilis]|uniref:Glucose-1-phosphate adenylyltransferase n=1 Tax=Tautonia sociabilis TaxID=2080755 RepID=A0A432MF94_9BACT|nr:glucose-1-phosphate adenylyltransferase [Tautonia sociabilis]RUL84668.1 glucose-1-phosphate adenylyltransferase [Tautonia sociabilis]
MNRDIVTCLILGGGRGTRLFPLTAQRSKPAVPIAGKYRLIDIPISNCIYSGLNRMYVLTQFNSLSLHRHITNTYKFDAFGGGFVEILAAQQTMENQEWYQGTADAVRQNLSLLEHDPADLILILSGDQLYRMDFRDMIRVHRETRATATIAALPVDEQEATACGIMQIQPDGQVHNFVEKPKTREALDAVRTEPEALERIGLAAGSRPYLASMGIYLFDRQVLIDLLSRIEADDFGKGVFPAAIADPSCRVQIYPFDGYWEDIGTIGAFHRANIELTRTDAPFDFAANNQNIYTRPRHLSPSKITGATLTDVLIADGAAIGKGCVLERSVIGLRSQIGAGVTIRNSYVMGADVFEGEKRIRENQREGRPNIGVGDGSVIENAIIDKNARIGRGVKILNRDRVQESDDHGLFVIRDGVVVVPKFAIIPDGTEI